MSFVVLTRNPRSKRLVIIVNGDPDDIAEFKTRAEAEVAARNTTVCKAWGHEIVEIDKDWND